MNNNYSQQGNFGIGQVNGGVLNNKSTIAGVNKQEQKQSLSEVAQEIQDLLNQLAITNSFETKTKAEKEDVARQVINEIQENPTLFDNILQVLRVSGAAALKQSINHPIATFLVTVIDEAVKIQKKQTESDSFPRP
ncbi:hypothetical protein JJD41_17000 [Oxynema sp. CENA135]|uniref:hypothetical protein n=1 Tax=Oxynema sp. CENA135 TaxID=984206 RepID=UPI00190D8A7C|nr:hypothetical protein [Oxynema sp. CENA135]MBK4731550.1 hypothetical protein [Oxynema sp. CENA135]